MVLLTLACARTQPDVIIVTATFDVADNTVLSAPTAIQEMPVTAIERPTPNPTRPRPSTASTEYTVQQGDTLAGIAVANGVSLELLSEINQLDNPNLLTVGQVLQLPAPPTDETPSYKIISDVRFVRSASANGFHVQQFVSQQTGYIRDAVEPVELSRSSGIREEIQLPAAQIVERVSIEFSVDPRLLLALLEYRSGWLTRPVLSEEARRFPMGEVNENREGLYKQLAWAANQLNAGYYGYKYRGIETLTFDGGERLRYNTALNPGTIGVQYFLSLNNTYANWLQQASPGNFDAFYLSLFGDPFAEETQLLVPVNLQQPDFILPFSDNEVWFYTGGPHGAWGSGSAWSAIDFAPPDEPSTVASACYTSQFAVRAIADGHITRSADGMVIHDLDDDRDDTTGWVILYLHIASINRVVPDIQVSAGDVIGYASCEGGFSTATHMHVARRYNGEWIPAYCHHCDETTTVPAFNMGGWSVIGFDGQEYQGIMVRDNERRQAEQGRQNPINRIAW